MNKVISLGLVIGLIAVSCSDPNTIGLEIQPTSDNIIISSSNFEGFTSVTESEDSLRTDENLNLVLGEISDPVFGHNQGTFYTQILLSENNNTLGENPTVDSIILSYTSSTPSGFPWTLFNPTASIKNFPRSNSNNCPLFISGTKIF